MTSNARREYGGGVIPAHAVWETLQPAIAEDGLETVLARAGVTLSGRRRHDLQNGGEIPLDLADRLLTFGLGDPAALRHILGEDSVQLTCDDCGKTIEAGDYRPLELWRPVPDAPAGKRARAGGRRKRRYDLCRKCAGEALRQRSAKKGARYKRDGVFRNLRTRDRVAPGKPGRPRLLTDDELRSAHSIYESAGLSMGDLADSLNQSRQRGTRAGYYSALLYGWRRLGLKLRPAGEAIALAHHRRGRIPEPKLICSATKRNGRPCTAPVKHGHDVCVSHLRYG